MSRASQPTIDSRTSCACANCGATLIGPHCHSCGQRAIVPDTLHGFVDDVLHSAFHIEGRLLTTLKLLIARPGELTTRYVRGERTRFVSPIGTFLFCILVMTGSLALASAAIDGDALRVNRSAIDAIHDEVGTPRRPASSVGIKIVDRGLARVGGDMELATYELQENAFKFSWAIVPLMLPLVALALRGCADASPFRHAAFTTYALAVATLLFTLCACLEPLGISYRWSLSIAIGLWTAHCWLHLRTAYALGSWPAACHSAFIVGAALFATSLFLILLLGAEVL